MTNAITKAAPEYSAGDVIDRVIETGVDRALTDTGYWTFENNLAVYRHSHGKVDRYKRPSLEVAIQNVKNNRNAYATYEAYQRDWFHFERGLGLFKAAEAAHQAT